jgi:hypothetical protein
MPAAQFAIGNSQWANAFGSIGNGQMPAAQSAISMGNSQQAIGKM